MDERTVQAAEHGASKEQTPRIHILKTKQVGGIVMLVLCIYPVTRPTGQNARAGEA